MDPIVEGENADRERRIVKAILETRKDSRFDGGEQAANEAKRLIDEIGETVDRTWKDVFRQ